MSLSDGELVAVIFCSVFVFIVICIFWIDSGTRCFCTCFTFWKDFCSCIGQGFRECFCYCIDPQNEWINDPRERTPLRADENV